MLIDNGNFVKISPKLLTNHRPMVIALGRINAWLGSGCPCGSWAGKRGRLGSAELGQYQRATSARLVFGIVDNFLSMDSTKSVISSELIGRFGRIVIIVESVKLKNLWIKENVT